MTRCANYRSLRASYTQFASLLQHRNAFTDTRRINSPSRSLENRIHAKTVKNCRTLRANQLWDQKRLIP